MPNQGKQTKATVVLPVGARVYVLSGASHLGKTTTLNKLAAYMASIPGWTVNPAPIVGPKDCKYIITNQRRRLTVGISTAGDNADEINKGFKHFRSNRCNVCFIASKTSGDSIVEIEKECKADKVVPEYQFLHGEYASRIRNQVQSDIVTQLFNMI